MVPILFSFLKSWHRYSSILNIEVMILYMNALYAHVESLDRNSAHLIGCVDVPTPHPHYTAERAVKLLIFVESTLVKIDLFRH